MKTFLYSSMILTLLVLQSCASGYKASPEAMAALDQLVTQQRFEVRAGWAQPMANQSLSMIASAGLLPQGSTATRIDISGTGGYLRVVGDSLMADLPYFGERRMGGYYDSNKTGIHFKGIPKEFSLAPSEKGNGYTLKFTINDGPESYQVVGQLYPNNMARLAVSSSHRTNIWYQGDLFEYKKE